MAQQDQRLTPQEAIAIARPDSKPGSSLTVLREIVATAGTQHIGDQALESAQAHGTKLYKNGILIDVLKSGGFLLAETKPGTNNLIALHLVSLGPARAPIDTLYWSDGIVDLADAQELVRQTAEFVEELYSTPSSEDLSLENRFYGGSFPEYGESDDYSFFAIPRSLLKVGSGQDEYRKAAALYGGYLFWSARYAVTMPAFAANPAAAESAAESKRSVLKAEFLRKNRMDPDLDLALENIQSKAQLRERIDVLARLDSFMEGVLKNEAKPALVKANVSVAAIPLGLGADEYGRQVLYGSGVASLFVIYWQPLSKAGFAVYGISVAG
jgi:hypothetical protein